MKCPKNLGKYPFEGGEDCRADCALAVTNYKGDYACVWTVALCQLLEEHGLPLRMNWTRKDDE